MVTNLNQQLQDVRSKLASLGYSAEEIERLTRLTRDDLSLHPNPLPSPRTVAKKTPLPKGVRASEGTVVEEHSEDVATTIGQRLTERRTQLNISQKVLSEIAGLDSRGIVSALERGLNKGYQYIPVLALALGVEAVWLADGKGEKLRTVNYSIPPFSGKKTTMSARILQARQRRRMSYEAVACLAEMDPLSLVRMERGVYKNYKDVPRLARALGIEALWLADGRGEAERYPDPFLEKRMEFIKSLSYHQMVVGSPLRLPHMESCAAADEAQQVANASDEEGKTESFVPDVKIYENPTFFARHPYFPNITGESDTEGLEDIDDFAKRLLAKQEAEGNGPAIPELLETLYQRLHHYSPEELDLFESVASAYIRLPNEYVRKRLGCGLARIIEAGTAYV